MNPIALTGTPWQLRPVEAFNQGFYPLTDDGWIEQQLPAHWQQVPSLRFYTGKVVYYHRFQQPSSDRGPRRYWLRADGIFYWSQIFLNGRDFGRHEGYFVPQEYEVTTILEPENTLIVEVDCPEERRKSGKRMLTGVFSHWDAIDPMTNPGGIWLPIVLEESGPVRLQQVQLQTTSIADTTATIDWRVELDSLAVLDAELRWTFTPTNVVGPAHTLSETRRLGGGWQRLSGTLSLPDPRLWWTHDLGDPNLYTVTLEVHCLGGVSDVRSLRFGVRTFEFRDFIAYLNGTRFLIKGNNYPPTDTRIATATVERVRQDLQLVRDCHMNLLRVHAHVGHPALYEMADELGVLLWQDFPMQWTYQRSVVPHARRQVMEMIRLLGNHPSVAVWCMHNEPIFITDTSDERIITGLRIYFSTFVWSWNRDVLDRRLARITRAFDRTRPVISNSGEYAVPFWHRGNDTHFYYGWYIIYGRLHGFDKLPQRFPRNLRFVTEFGAQSFPNKASCLKFMPENMVWIDWNHLHRRHSFQGNVMRHWFDWREHRTLDTLIEQTQRYQSELNRFYTDRLRLRKYRPTGGIVPFMLLDSNPAVQWSIIDYWRVPKASYWAMREAFRPQYAFTIIDKSRYMLGDRLSLPLYGVNDAQRAARYRLHAVVTDPQLRRVAEHTVIGEFAADCYTEELGRLEFVADRRGHYEVLIRLDCNGERLLNTYQVRVGRRPKPRNLVQKTIQALAASLAFIRWSVAAIR
jgi:beta-mannosidase